MVVAPEVPARGLAVPPRWRILVLRSFASASKGPNISAQGIAQGGVGIAVGVTRRPRGARRGSPDPAGLPDRQVSRAHRRPSFQRCSCLLSLRQTKETYRSSIWAGSGDPRPARVRAYGGVRSRYRYRFCRGIGIWSVYTRTISQYRRPAPSAGVLAWGVEKLRGVVAALLSFLLRRLGNGRVISPLGKGGN